MPPDRLTRHLAIAFGLALTLYVLGYWLIESRRVRHTPWLVTFAPETQPPALSLTVEQQSLALGPVTLRVPVAVTNLPTTTTQWSFNRVRPVPFAVPGGACVFHDATFMPGTVVLEFNGVPLQLLARSLTVGTNEFPWSHREVIDLTAPAAVAR